MIYPIACRWIRLVESSVKSRSRGAQDMTKVHNTGKSFTVADGEGRSVCVELNDPLEEELSGIVEVIGMVSNKGAIRAITFNMLRDEKGIPFDLELYNEAVKVIHDFPQHYPFDMAASR
ncbi:replication protein A 14 kDa subunit isoform X2 [Syngnathus acus]|uniref:replication protein A 14 kDa subunit isoform X2 n=1 Tax=Syngnathus acus TaxID=161584 RepID=UPI0018862FFD|nr:replication protein A 14 kDa subunit isoform X2 [Syngnathus acus]